MADIDEDWEEWDGVSPFWHHCLAGSVAGLAEHTLVYPLDTVRTHIQVCANCKFSPSFRANNLSNNTLSSKAAAAATTSVGSSAATTKSAAASSALHPHQHASTTTASPRAGRPLASRPHQQQLPQGMWQTMRYLMSEPVVLAEQAAAATTVASSSAAAVAAPPKTEGILRLWRGVQTMLIGCIPAHALYFSSYEIVKAYFQQQSPTSEIVWYGSMMAGATATLGHDLIMAPLDTVKQRLQIGHYQGSMSYALKQMVQKEGSVALYRSFPITVLANLPYGMIMVSTNESLKQLWTRSPDGLAGHPQPLTLTTTLMASSAAGLVASAATTPLDRIKTLLQTQQMAPACWPTPPANCPRSGMVNAAAAAAAAANSQEPAVVQNAYQALQHILKQEGPVGLFRGIVPRVMSHTPAVAISWTTYETAKSVLWKATN